MKVLTMGLVIIAFLMSAQSQKPPCSCRPDIPADGTGDGTCSVTQDGANWCEIRFSGTGQGSSKFADDLALLHKPGTARQGALRRLGSTHPEDWDRAFVVEFVPAMLEDSLANRAPDRLKDITRIVQIAASDVLPSLKDRSPHAKEFTFGQYKTSVSYGCIDFTSGGFAAMVRSEFSEAPHRCQWK
jgi:hypothetical protein